MVIFDLDGTLVDAYRAIVASLNYTLGRLKYPLKDPLSIRRAVGWGDKALVRPFVGKKDLSRALGIYRRHHKRSLRQMSRLAKGARKLLKFLKVKGYRLAVASNRPYRFTLIIIRHLKLDKYFDFVLCGDQVKNSKPAPDMIIKIMRHLKVGRHQTLYVGDMDVDIKTANRAGVNSIAVLGGSSSISSIKKEKPYKIIKNISILRRLL